MTYFHDKTVLVTGANGGLGAEMARQLADAGARLILTDIGDKSIQTNSQHLAYIQSDLSTADGCKKLIAEAKSASPTLDILINNAGLATVGNFVDTPDDKWEAVLNINLLVPMRLSKLVLPDMIQRQSGHIVNISSVGGFISLPKTSPYVASKWGLRGFGAALRAEVADKNILVSNVYPFFTPTPILQSGRFGKTTQKTELPSFFLDDKKDVIKQTLKGIAAGNLHIFPSFRSKIVGESARFLPEVTEFVTRKFWDYIG